MASSQKVPSKQQAKKLYQVGPQYLKKKISNLEPMNYFSAFLGNPSFKKHNITIDTKKKLLQLPFLKVQFNQILPKNGKKS